jgi:hypothetical protein
LNGNRSLGDTFVTIPSALRALQGEAGATPDPFDPTSSIGGYCTLLGGKFTPSGGRRDFAAQARVGARRLGKLSCSDGPPGQPPVCGSDRNPGIDPTTVPAMADLFQFIDGMFYPVPGRPGSFATQPFFAWYAPRIPHAPLRAPAAVRKYLFGTGPGLGGLFNLGALCRGDVCPSAVRAFDESNNFGRQRDYYANVWWLDDNIRELRKYLARQSAPHCILRYGESRLAATSPAQCVGGTWATHFTSPVDRNTIIIYLSDNGWFLPDSKHHFTENGYRTQIFVYDPRTADPMPPLRAAGVAPPPYESPELAHATDILPTVLGFALATPGTQACPESADGTPCDGRDLRSYLRTAHGSPDPQAPLRHALCGHQTNRASAPTRQRYLLTRPGTVGRCIDITLPSCHTTASCAAGQVCLGGRCTVADETGCSTTAQCAKGALCLGGRCRPGPPCLDDVSCTSAFGSSAVRCAERERKWCRNAPNTTCTTAADCPACEPVAPGAAAPPCGRVCEPHVLKLYVGTGNYDDELVDLFTDPDEWTRRAGDDPLLLDMSSPDGPYGADVRRLSCCVDDWWPEAVSSRTACRQDSPCPADFVCNE